MCDLLLSRGNLHYLDVEHERLMSFAEFRRAYPKLAGAVRSCKKLDELKINSFRK